MAEEVQYSSDGGSNKRKYEEQTTPPLSRRPTGFSAPNSSTSPDAGQAPPSYNSVPPPAADDVDAQFQSAKQRAQEIASRLLFNASLGAGAGAGAGGGFDAKRVRVENGSGFDSPNKDGKPAMNSAPSAIPAYNFPQNTSKKINIPNGRVGVIIGKSGETIKYLQLQSGAKIQVTRDMDADPNSPTRMVELMGTPEQIAKAEQLINEVLSEAEAGGSGIVSRRITGQTGSDQFVMRIPNNKVGLVIGKGGEMIKNMQARTGARIQVVPLHLPPGDTSTERSVHIDGTEEQIEAAKLLVNEVISENRMRNSGMGGGGYTQQGYQARPQTSWGAHSAAPQMQQAGYGYVQPGAYPGAPQYMSQPQYGGYPAQPASSGYAANWDQSSTPAAQQGGSAGYDYYSQQPPSQQQQAPGAPAGQGDQSGYNYSQAPASSYPQQGQGYSQDGYGGYHAPQSGYAQQPHYDQQQQGGYNSSVGYGSTQDGGHASYGTQGDSTQVQPPVQPPAMSQAGYSSGQPGYGMPPTSQAGYPPTSQPGYGPGYGPPPAQKPPANPPAYGQSQQSPSTPGGYGQAPAAAQAGYPHSQPPSSGYGAPAYGVAPQPAASQPGYGQQQPPPYSGYGTSAYPQPPPVYAAADGSGAPAAVPPSSQGAPVSTAPKASPKS